MGNKVVILDHPLIQHKLSILRDKETSTKDFRQLVNEISMLMIYEATRDLPLEDVQVANYNCPGQIVISGKTEAVKLAEEKLKEAGARRILPLNVSGPFHSGLLEEAGRKLGEYLKQVELHEPVIPYVANVTADYVTNVIEVKPLLSKQVSSSVLWQQSVEAMIADGVDRFIEIGPGKTLAGFIKKIDRNVTVINIEKVEDLEKLGVNSYEFNR